MSESTETKKPTVFTQVSSPSSVERGEVEHISLDTLEEQSPHAPALRKRFTIWSVLGCGFGLTNSWAGISASLVTGISSGGPLMIMYGILIISAVATFIGVSLSELVSAYPENSGGQYYWTSQLAPKKYRRFWAYMCGLFGWYGAIFTSASVTFTVVYSSVGLYQLSTDSTEPPSNWVVFVTFELANLFVLFFNIWDTPLPALSTAALYMSLFAFVVISLTVAISSRGEYQSAHFVFVEFTNGTGWSSPVVAFLVGLINPMFSFSCLDAATHMSEEMYEPERWIPISIMSTVAIGLSTSFMFSLAMFFSIKDLDAILNSVTGMPILDLFKQACGKKVAMFLGVLMFFTTITCNVVCHTWTARLCYSFSRDDGIPGSRYWKQINPKTNLPVNAHLISCFCSAVIGCIYMGSATAYNSVVVSCIVFLLLSYAIPIVALLLKGRNNIKHGPFWLGWFGLLSNIATLAWALFALVIFCLPAVMPASPGTMNYASAVLAGITAYSVIYWFARGRKKFTLHDVRIEMAEISESSK